MQTHQIKRTHKLKKSKQLARGGRHGKTAGRGGKGQTARAGNRVRPAFRDEIKKLPKLRGHGINRSHTVVYKDPKKFAILNLSDLNVFENGEIVNPASLVAKGLVKLRNGKIPKIKILGKGELMKKIKIEDCQISKSVETKIK